MSKMEIISWNINGIRTRFKNKEIDPIFSEIPDIILFQETKAKYEQLDSKLKNIDDYYSYFSPGQSTRAGGIAAFSKIKPQLVKKFLDKPDDSLNGRVLNFTFDEFVLLHIYAPSGTGAKVNLEKKISFFDELLKIAKKLADKKVIVAGDFNIAHGEKDISNPQDNQKSVNFLEKEREVLDKLEELGYVDSYRSLNTDKTEYSSWKSAKAKETNEGARLDYFFVSKNLKESIKEATIMSDIEGSKHAPVKIVLDI
ncbi:exodeoxyribonuclease [Methanobrevibacter cuticularis]|uniref:Exodeoxyribonuclease n=1 Tax=Methanobrevibacter cuticularis TaxID=47311 RepID=A0A166FC18_9EURY|nr:exodeoxyribonuclease III [Methanobrevibacter cuticularis]KZX17518.1 exodeoxyribonuclease [Methanobrevibacter cuticularis]